MWTAVGDIAPAVFLLIKLTVMINWRHITQYVQPVVDHFSIEQRTFLGKTKYWFIIITTTLTEEIYFGGAGKLQSRSPENGGRSGGFWLWPDINRWRQRQLGGDPDGPHPFIQSAPLYIALELSHGSFLCALSCKS